MSDSTAPLTPNPEEFARLAQFLAAGIADPMAGTVPEDLLQVPIVLPVTLVNDDGVHIFHSSSSMFLSASQENDMTLIKMANTPYLVGSRPEYKVAIAFDQMDEILPALREGGVTDTMVVSFQELLLTCYRSDFGFCLIGGEQVLMMEPDRINEYVRATFEVQHVQPQQEQITDIGPHRLRPEELAALEELISEYDWVVSYEVASARMDGQFVNFLALKADYRYDPELINVQCYEISEKATNIKSPFLVGAQFGIEPPAQGR